MIERIVFLQCEDNIVSFEKENGDVIFYPISIIPPTFKEGDIINVIIHDENFIEFLELDVDEMNSRHKQLTERRLKLRERAKRSTNNA